MTSPQAGPEGTPALGASRVTGTGRARTRAVPQATVARLAVYLRMLGELVGRGTDTVSSDELAAVCGVNSAMLRKDLSHVGSHGIRGVGYEVGPLLRHLEAALGLTHRQSVALVGIGNLGHALAGYGGFGGRGFPVTALFDVDPDLVGIKINGIVVEHVRDIPQTCRERDVTIGMIATPAPAAQGACDLLVRAGVSSILNFAPVVLQVPEQVEVRKVDLAVELQILAFHVARRHLTGSDRSGHDADALQSVRGGRPAPDPGRDAVNVRAVVTS